MLDLVPLTRARRDMANCDRQTQLVHKTLQAKLPKSTTAAVAAASVGRNQKFLHIWVDSRAHAVPPTTDRFDRELRGIAVYAHVYPPFVLRDIIYAVRNSNPKVFVLKVVRAHRLGRPLGTPLAAGVLKIPDQFESVASLPRIGSDLVNIFSIFSEPFSSRRVTMPGPGEYVADATMLSFPGVRHYVVLGARLGTEFAEPGSSQFADWHCRRVAMAREPAKSILPRSQGV